MTASNESNAFDVIGANWYLYTSDCLTGSWRLKNLLRLVWVRILQARSCTSPVTHVDAIIICRLI